MLFGAKISVLALKEKVMLALFHQKKMFQISKFLT